MEIILISLFIGIVIVALIVSIALTKYIKKHDEFIRNASSSNMTLSLDLLNTMRLPTLSVKKLHEDAKLPFNDPKETNSGYDLFILKDTLIPPNSTIIIPTGIAVDIPEHFEGEVRPRSGITSKTSLRVQLGTIDAGYHGDIGIIVDNIGNEPITLNRHYKLAQLVVSPIVKPSLVSTSDFDTKSNRGTKGFGSSGV